VGIKMGITKRTQICSAIVSVTLAYSSVTVLKDLNAGLKAYGEAKTTTERQLIGADIANAAALLTADGYSISELEYFEDENLEIHALLTVTAP